MSEFAASKYGTPDYAELPQLPFDVNQTDSLWDSEASRRVFGKIRRERRKLSLIFGYPTRLAFVRAKSGWEGYFVEPLLVFELDVEHGGSPTLSDERPEFNIRALRALSGQSGPELLDEVILLQQELGINSCPPGTPSIRIGSGSYTSAIEAVAYGLGDAVRNALHQDRDHPLEATDRPRTWQDPDAWKDAVSMMSALWRDQEPDHGR